MTKKKRKANKKPSRLRLKRRLEKRRAYDYAIRILAASDGLTYRQAQKKYKRAQLDVVIRRAERDTQDEWLEVNPHTFFKVKKGMLADNFENVEGPPRTAAYVEGMRKRRIYWNTVEMLAGVLDITPKEAQAYIAQQKREIAQKTGWKGSRLKTALEWSIWIDLGVYREGSPRLT